MTFPNASRALKCQIDVIAATNMPDVIEALKLWGGELISVDTSWPSRHRQVYVFADSSTLALYPSTATMKHSSAAVIPTNQR